MKIDPTSQSPPAWNTVMPTDLPVASGEAATRPRPAGRQPQGSVERCEVIELPRIEDARGNLSFVEGGNHVPFSIARMYYLYDVPGGESRGGHAHQQLEQLVIAMSGAFEIVLDDGYEQRLIGLNRSYYGLYIPRMVWRELVNFSSGSVCAVLASEPYDESDYFRDYDEFLTATLGA